MSFSGAYKLSEDDEKTLLMHFTGTAPKDYLTAQQKADQLNLTARLLWDHNLLDLYRRLSAIPGARMGYATGAEGTQLWLEIRKPKPALAAAPAAALAARGSERRTPASRPRAAEGAAGRCSCTSSTRTAVPVVRTHGHAQPRRCGR